ncbi:transmembrane protease serine 2-like [Brachionichthys hirsutus]|uniref:transmembrane protease serine 2-like n=1 Tax=Brachionichthys hirsutus TaxID=412623 RepID=UPI00360514DE
MSTNPYLNVGEKRKLPPAGRSQDEPQYVHHLSPKPSPEVGFSIPGRKDVKERCAKYAEVAVFSLLLLLLVAGILLGYYCSSTCLHGRQCGDGGCVWESQWCDGVSDCPSGQDEADCVRLHGSTFVLQIYSGSNWRTVCSDGWTEQQGKAACRHIGYSRGTHFRSGQRKAESVDGFLTARPGFNPEASVLKQLEFSRTCPNNTVVTLHCTDCGRGVNSSRAYRSQRVSLGSWPWQVSLQVAGSHRCSGAIISPYWTVTAAHCVSRTSNPAEWTAYAGIVDPLGTLFNPSHPVSLIIPHEGFDSLTRKNDIALMRLAKPLDFTGASGHIGPVCLPSAALNLTDHRRGWVTHFTHRSGGLYLTGDQVSIADAVDCNATVAYGGRISRDMLCAKETEAEPKACASDGGSPLVSLKDGLWWLVGDSIWGDHCAVRRKPGVFGNVTYFLDWIYHQMKNHQDD